MAKNQKHLTTAYRPQTFEEVVGQKPICKILSRAASESKIAPAYMFSGTRGVGKTTIARILAKAINCQQAPVAEPCNNCYSCQQITQGTCMDVFEIDGASHTGVDHVRKLNEDVEYAPLECRYKVIIIDEAHMLSRSAFNALLKTLEEPPKHAIFILATTEPHKFPATIVSRCQHFVFKRIPQRELERYLSSILEKEGIDFEQNALSMLVRKGSGSVRDSLSLLSQIIALGEKNVSLEIVQEVLGVAGHEIMIELMKAFSYKDCSALVSLVRKLFGEGLDLVFFLQELATVWRNMFILKQTGERGLELLEMPEEEAKDWLKWSKTFSLQYIHTAWQMTLEGQKRVISSYDPALSLELLLLNIAYLSDLLPIQEASLASGSKSKEKQQEMLQETEDSSALDGFTEKVSSDSISSKSVEADKKDWQHFLSYIKSKSNGKTLPNLHLVKGIIKGDVLELYCPQFLDKRLIEKDKFQYLSGLVQEYFNSPMQIKILRNQENQNITELDLKKKVLNDPIIKNAIDEFQAKILEVKPR